MKIGIAKDNLRAMTKSFCTLISGAGIGMFLAVAFIPEDERKIFHFHYFVTAWLLVLGSGLLRSIANWLLSKKVKKELVDEKHVA